MYYYYIASAYEAAVKLPNGAANAENVAIESLQSMCSCMAVKELLILCHMEDIFVVLLHYK